MPRGKRNTPFQPGHGMFYALRPVSRDPVTNVVTAVACRFCEKFGREEKVGAKRRATQHVKHFKQPFRTENYHQHHLGQHPTRWTEYKGLSPERKVLYLASANDQSANDYSHIENVVSNPTPITPSTAPPITDAVVDQPNLLPAGALAADQDRPIKFAIEKPIVDVVIGDLLFDEQIESVPKDRAIRAFTTTQQSTTDYFVNIKNRRLYDVTVKFVALGASPKLTTGLITQMPLVQSSPSSTMKFLEECTEQKVIAYIRCVWAANFQGLADLMRDSWAFSLSFDRSTHRQTFFLQVRIRFCIADDMHSFHILALPLPDRYNYETISKSLIRLLDVLCTTWRDKLIGLSTDGFEVVNSPTHVIVDTIKGQASSTVIRSWSGANQLDLVMKYVYNTVLNDEFYDVLSQLIAYLRRQDTLIEEMKSVCPRLSPSSWLSVEKCLKWIKTNRIRLLQYLEEKKPGSEPDMSWWVLAMALWEFTHAAEKTYHRIRGLTTMVSQQTSELSELVQTLHRISGCKGPITDDELSLLTEWDLILERKYVVHKSTIRNFLSGLGSFIHIAMGELPPPTLDEVIKKVGTMFLSAVVCLSDIIRDRDGGSPVARLPPVLPHELIKLTRAAFNSDVRNQAHRLSTTFSPAEIEYIEQEFGEFLEAYHREEVFKASLHAIDESTSFSNAWGILKKRFRHLFFYCGGIASAYPEVGGENPSFSILQWETEVFESSKTTDFSLEGFLHSKQYSRLQKLLDSIR